MDEKTITIDLTAYELLDRHKHAGQSFSQVIKEHFDAPPTRRDLLAALDRVTLAPSTLDAIDELVAERQRDSACAG